MKHHLAIVTSLLLFITGNSDGEEFRHVGDYLLKSHFKLTGSKKTPIPMKPIAFRVYTDGVTVKVATEGAEDAYTKFEIYRSDGISRQRTGGGAIEIIPGVQATSMIGGVLKHLRLSGESMTITTFPGVSNQTIVSHSVAAEAIEKDPSPEKDPSTTQDGRPPAQDKKAAVTRDGG